MTDACWIWKGGQAGDGYGSFDQERAHRVAYELFIGPIPEGRDICHSCDVPLCVRPAHLFPGTPKQNSEDMVTKGRSVRGEKQHSAKLTAELVKQIRELYVPYRVPMKQVAATLDVSLWAVYDVIRGKSWGWL